MYRNICTLCGKEFDARQKKQKLCTSPHPKICEVCGKEFEVTIKNYRTRFCSQKCNATYQKSNPSTKYKHICKLCGKEFYHSQPDKMLCQEPHPKTCINCGKEFEVITRSQNKIYCSTECKVEHMKKTGRTKEISDKSEATKKKKYLDKGIVYNNPKNITRICIICGEEFEIEKPNQKVCSKEHYKNCYICSKPVKVGPHNYMNDVTCSKKCKYELVKQTNLGRYGFDNAMKSPEIQERIKKTNQERYGYDFPLCSKEVRDKINKSRLERTGYLYSFSDPRIRSTIIKTNMTKYGVPWYCLVKNCVARNGKTVSRINRKFKSYSQDRNIDLTYEFLLGTHRFDFKLTNKDILIEINPTYTHNSHWNHWHETGIEKDYHINITKLANDSGYRCIHIWDWDDWDKVINLLRPIEQTIYARKCNIMEVPKKECDEFLNNYHLQGTCRGQKYRYGLYHDSKLVGIMTFGSPRYNKKYEYELLRLCFLPGYRVIGGSEKLFKHFINNNNPKSIISYCDRSKFSGEVYSRLGMKLLSEGIPNKHWYSPKRSDKLQHITNNLLLQRGFDQLFGTDYGKGTSNEKLILERGYLPVFDCGQMVFGWKFS